MVEEGNLKRGSGGFNAPQSRHRLWRYGPLLIWLVLIFIGSSSILSASNTSIIVRLVIWLFPSTSPETLGFLHFIIRKAGHFSVYAVLGLLAARAFTTSSRELLRNHWFWVSLVLVIVYSLSDEFHQSFVPSRTASLFDSAIDSLGGLVALLVYRRRFRPAPPERTGLSNQPPEFELQ
jgi:VanZ family protein